MVNNVNYIFTFITIVFCLVPTFLSVFSIYKVGLKPFTALQILFFFVFIFPLMLDVFFGAPVYASFPGFYEAENSKLTSYIYNLFILFVSFFNWFARGKKTIEVSFRDTGIKFDIFLLLLMFIPIFLFLLSPDQSYYKIYGGNPARNYSVEAASFHGFINVSSFISVIFGAYLISKYFSKNILFGVFLCAIVFIDFWLNGKRTIVLLFSFFLGLFFWLNYKNLKTVFLIFTLFFSFLIFSNWYQSNVRDFGDQVSVEENYENIRIDFFRDQRVKMAIYSELYPHHMKILSYPGQSFVFVSTFYIPRSIWLDKPYPYAQYFTSALYFSDAKLWGWGMTTSIYDEFIANFGFFGVIILQVLLFYYFKSVYKVNSNYFKVFSLFLVMLLFMVQIIAFMAIYIFWLMWFLKLKNKFRLKG